MLCLKEDRFASPRLGSRVRVIVGTPLLASHQRALFVRNLEESIQRGLAVRVSQGIASRFIVIVFVFLFFDDSLGPLLGRRRKEIHQGGLAVHGCCCWIGGHSAEDRESRGRLVRGRDTGNNNEIRCATKIAMDVGGLSTSDDTELRVRAARRLPRLLG